MFVVIKNNMPDATAVVAFTHIPPGEVRNVEQVHYTKWFQGGGHRLLDAGMVAEVTAQAVSAGLAPAAPVIEEEQVEAPVEELQLPVEPAPEPEVQPSIEAEAEATDAPRRNRRK